MLRFTLILVLTLLDSEARAWTHGAVCSQATTALAALSGLNSAQQAAYVTMICGMVVDGDFAHLTGLWTSTTSQANSLVNLATPGTHNLTNHGSTFANPGWAGNGSSLYLDTGIVGGGGTQNSSSLGVCVLNSRTTFNINAYQIGAATGSNYSIIAPNEGTVNGFQLEVNGDTLPSPSTGSTNIHGAYAAVRTNSANINGYYNGAGVAANPITSTSQGTPAASFFILAYNLGGVATNYSPDTVGYAWVGDGSVNPTNVYNRLHTFITDASIGGGAC